MTELGIKARRPVTARIVKVDKNMAELFLSFEKQPQKGVKGTNRKFDPGTVNKYAIDILTGEWDEFTHQGFGFTGFLDDGTAELRDGGQRCRAVIQAATLGAREVDGTMYPPDPDASIEVMVTEGMNEKAAMRMDIGRHRTPAHFLGMEGEVNANVLASTVALCILYEQVPWNEHGWKGRRISGPRRQKYLEDNPGIRDAIAAGARVGQIVTVSAAAAGYHLALKSGISVKDLDVFMDAVRDGTNMDKGDPRLVLREMMNNARRKHRKWTRERQFALFIKALTKWLNNEPVALLSFKVTDNFPRFAD